MHLVLVAAAGGGFSTRRRRHAACFSFISSRRFYWSIAWQFEGKTACPSVFMNRRPTRRQSARFKVLPRIGTVQTNQWNLKENGKKTFLRNKRGWIFMLARGRFKKKTTVQNYMMYGFYSAWLSFILRYIASWLLQKYLQLAGDARSRCPILSHFNREGLWNNRPDFACKSNQETLSATQPQGLLCFLSTEKTFKITRNISMEIIRGVPVDM
jgi:hypothetical protein